MTRADSGLATAARNADVTDDASGNPSVIGRIIAIAERSRVLVAEPLHQERIADEERRKAERVRDAIRRRANAMDIPKDEDLRAIVEDDGACVTDAMVAVRGGLAWRGTRHRALLVVLGGPPGVGKTAAACHALVRYDGGGLYVSAVQVCSTPRTGHSSTEELWVRWSSVPMLVIDDAGAENSRSDLLGALLRVRYDAGLVTMMSTNLSRRGVETKYLRDEHGRLADRLVNAQGRGVGDAVGEGGIDWFFALDGASLRSVEARDRLLRGSSR